MLLLAALVPLSRGELRVRYRLEVVDPTAGRVQVEASFQSEADLGDATLVDRFADYYSRGLPGLSREARPQIEAEELCSEEGPLPLPPEPGQRHVQLGTCRQLTLRRSLCVPDRTSGEHEHHPSASSLSPSSAVFAGMDLFPLLEGDSLTPAGDVELEVVLPEGWSLATPWGPGPRVHVPSTDELLENYFFAAPELEQRTLEREGTEVAVVSARGALNPEVWHAQVLTALDQAFEIFGPLPGGGRLVILQGLSDTAFHRTLVDRGVNGPRSVVAYVDDRNDSAYAQSPLSVVVHEAVHWWITRAMNFQKGSHLPWFSEGLATYYESLLLLRAGIVDFPFFAQGIVDQWLLDRDRAGARLTLEEASGHFAENPLATDVTYRRGALTAFVLDVELRRSSSCLLSLDSVVRRLLGQGQKSAEGLRSTDVPRALETLGGPQLMQLFETWMTAESTPDLADSLEAIGVAVEEHEQAYLGVRIGPGSPPPLEMVLPRGPAAGILQAADVVRSLAGQPVASRAELEAGLARCAPGDAVEIRLLRQGTELTVKVTLGGRPAPRARELPDLDRLQALLRATLERPRREFR